MLKSRLDLSLPVAERPPDRAPAEPAYPRRRAALPLALVALSASFAACDPGQTGGLLSGPPAPFQVRESIEQLQITHAQPGAEITLYDGKGMRLQSGQVDGMGSYVFRKLAPGGDYVVKTGAVRGQAGGEKSGLRVRSIAESKPDPSFYRSQRLQPGHGYLRTRDGTLLSIYVTLPGPPEKGPYPTVVNYSGYDPSKPDNRQAEFEFLCGTFPILCDPPADPSALISAVMGYATVGVNMRGTGCSGGAFDFFDTLQRMDAYDLVETIAAQDWVLHNKVGLTGISYPGYSQFFVAEQQPPSLAAIMPFSVMGDTYQTLMPGGLLNTGFAVGWVHQVQDRASPYGQGWEDNVVAGGDQTCAENQLLHGQKVDLMAQIAENPFYRSDIGDPLTPTTFVPKINVPVYLASAWQDEQTGPFFSSLFDRFTGSKTVRITTYNGVHVDAFAPGLLVEWGIFMDLYVARRIPRVDPTLRQLAPILLSRVFDAELELPPDRLAHHKTYEAALAEYESEPMIRILFESGAGPSGTPGAPDWSFERKFARWPLPETRPQRFYLQEGGGLATTTPTAMTAVSSFDHDASAGQRSILAPGGDPWARLPRTDWQQPRDGKALSYVSPAFTSDTVMAGTASLDLYVQSSASDADLQATISEVRPDGKETYVQTGWLRAAQRKLSPTATALWPQHTHLRDDVQPVAAAGGGDWSEVRIGIPAFAHAFRKGSRLRITLDTPGGTRAAWKFKLTDYKTNPTHYVAHDRGHASSLLLPILDGVPVPTPLPACPSLRGQPCRTYLPFSNRGATP
ncbi:MAG TPA: CocE/NonD family hydrolase [Pseudomonadota bacterium]|nr:CocE/NonD family hydrolase [Pseudomonadota bacterium]